MDVFLLMGQSNMAGRGLLEDVEAIRDERIRAFRDRRWSAAREPLHDDRPGAGVGLAMSFARRVLAAGACGEAGLVPCAVGSTPLQRWLPGADLYQRAVSLAREAAREGTVKAVLWHQGEQDSRAEADASGYCRRFVGMVQALRAELDAPALPVVAGELGEFLSQRPEFTHFRTVNAELRKASETLSACACASSRGLIDKGDSLHFDAPSLRRFGERYAEAYLGLQPSRFPLSRE